MNKLNELENLLAEWKQACARTDDPLQKGVIKLKALELACGIESALPELIASARRAERLEAALEVADKGLRAGIEQYASRSFTGSVVAADEQYPWVSQMMQASHTARTALQEQTRYMDKDEQAIMNRALLAQATSVRSLTRAQGKSS